MTAGRMGMLAGRVKGIPLRIERLQDASMSRLSGRHDSRSKIARHCGFQVIGKHPALTQN